MNCGLCGRPASEFYCRKGRFIIRRCMACGNGFLDLAATPLDPSALYREGYHLKQGKEADEQAMKGYDNYYSMAPAFRRTFRARLEDLLLLQGNGGDKTLLDIGCGPGFFLDEARSRYKVRGIELAPEAAEYARKRLGLDVTEAEFRGQDFPVESFDAVTMFDVIEHLPDPMQALSDVYRILKPGGCLMVTTGDFSSLMARLSGARWHLLTPPDHLFYFTRSGLSRLLEHRGFEVLGARYPRGHFTADYLIERLVKSWRLGMAYRRWGGLRSLLQRFILPMNLWDIMLIEARKPAS